MSLSDKIMIPRYAGWDSVYTEKHVKEFIKFRDELDLVRNELGEEEYIKQRNKLAGPKLI